MTRGRSFGVRTRAWAQDRSCAARHPGSPSRDRCLRARFLCVLVPPAVAWVCAVPWAPAGALAWADAVPVDAPSPSPGRGSLSRAQFRAAAGATAPSRFEGRVGEYRFTLDEPDDPAHPSVFEGPLRIAVAPRGDAGATEPCDVDASLISAVFAPSTGAGGPVVVVSQTGSLTSIQLVDPGTCRERWPKIEVFTEGVRVAGRLLEILPGCEGEGKDAPASCSAGRVLALDPERGPTLLPLESRALTKSILGVEFDGSRRVVHPKSPQARLAD